MVTLAILAIVAAIAIPAYDSYITESKRTAARSNAEPLRLALENYWLDNGSYPAFAGNTAKWDPTDNNARTLQTGGTPPLGWQPSGDEDQFIYTVTTDNATNSWSILVESVSNSNIWARIDKTASGRMVSCYDDTSGVANPNAPCPGAAGSGAGSAP